ncbi:MAG: ribonuclease D [Maricaulis sp.]|jgi:ribonuclease D|nr:ribonuclease D [Maricaulis sp.]
MNVITTNDALAEACTALRQCDFVAIDTEFMRESTYWPILCLIQAAGGETEVLIDPMADGIDLQPFFDLLADESVMKVFHAARQDLEIFYHKGEQLIPKPMFDSQIAAMALGLGDSIAYDNLVRMVLNRNVEKGARFTDWARRPLSDSQKGYALADVTHLRDMYPILRDRLDEQDRLSWVAEEMGILCNPATYALDPDEQWKRLKLRKTTPKWLAVLKASAAWREREAQTRDMPRQRVIKDEGLYELAHAAPTTPEQLVPLRSVPRGFERSKPAERLLDAIKAVIDDPKRHAPKVTPPAPPPAGAGPTTELLKVLLKLVADDIGVAPRLIATVPDLEAIAASDTADVAALKGWRREVFGETALRLKRGKIALLLQGGKVVARDL